MGQNLHVNMQSQSHKIRYQENGGAVLGQWTMRVDKNRLRDP